MNRNILIVFSVIAVASVLLLKWKAIPPMPLAEKPELMATGRPTPVAATGRTTPVAPSIPANASPVASPPMETAVSRPPTFPSPVVDPDGSALVPGEMVRAHMETGGQSGDLTPDQTGTFPVVHIDPKQKVSVTAAWPDGQPGQRVVAAVVDGGELAVDQRTLPLDLNAHNQVNFVFTAATAPGLYRVTLRKGVDVKTLSFWVNASVAAR